MALKRRNIDDPTAAGGCKFNFVVAADLRLTFQTQYFQVLYSILVYYCTAKRNGVADRCLHMYDSGVFCCGC